MADPITESITATTGAGASINSATTNAVIAVCPIGGVVNMPTPIPARQISVRNDSSNPCTIKFGLAQATIIYVIPFSVTFSFISNGIAWFTTAKPPLFIVAADAVVPPSFITADLIVDTSLASHKVSLPPVIAGAKYTFISASTSTGAGTVTVASTSGAVITGLIMAAGASGPTRVTNVSNLIFATAGGPADKIELRSDGTGWFFTAFTGAAGGITTS